MGFRIVTQPTTEPVTVAEAKMHLRVDGTDDDAMIGAMITAAREECEHLLERALAPQTVQLLLDEFQDEIPLPMPPLRSIVSVEYAAEDGTTTTVSSDDYTTDVGLEPPWLLQAGDATWPAADDVANAVTITYECGYSAEEIPKAIKHWILLRVGTLYAFREADSEKVPMPAPFADRMIDRYRVIRPY